MDNICQIISIEITYFKAVGTRSNEKYLRVSEPTYAITIPDMSSATVSTSIGDI